jgi:hypothetical protein
MTRPYLRPLLALLALLVALWVTLIPGVFTIDEPNYLSTVVSLRAGGWSLPGTEGLPSSTELLFFDPTQGLGREETPVRTVAPPLYAVLAWPFSWLGFQGLMVMNLLAFAIAAALVFRYSEALAQRPETPWVAGVAFTLGSFNIEYAQAMWPHMLSVALTTGAFVLAFRGRRQDRWGPAAVAGLLMGLAMGVRYQNVIFAGALGLTLLLLSRLRLRLSIAYGAFAALPLGASSLINHARLGFWNPISKGGGYLQVNAGGSEAPFLLQALHVFWAKVVDFATHPTIDIYRFYVEPRESGAFMIGTAVKKAWLQSTPWVALVLLVVAWAWLRLLRRNQRGEGEAGAAQWTELRALGVVMGLTLAGFAAAGFGRTDGLCFNQRYFLELVPLAAVALAWAVERFPPQRRPLLLGLLLGALVALAFLRLSPGVPARQVAILRIPLVVAVLFVAFWLMAHRHRWGRALVSGTLGLALMWSMAVHLADDLPMSRRLRQQNAQVGRILAPALPDRGVVFVWAAARNGLAPLLLERDLILVDFARDQGEDASLLLDAFLERGDRVILVPVGAPRPVLDPLLEGRYLKVLEQEPVPVLEITPLTRTTPAASGPEGAATVPPPTAD